MILAAFVIGFYVSAGIVFTFHKVDMRISRAQPPIADKSTGKERLHPGSVQEARTLDVTLDNFSLSIQKKNPLGKTIKTIPILHPLSARFEPGILNVIMGVSGGGKTSLLNM